MGAAAGRGEERHFLNLDIGLPVEQLRQSIKGCLNGDKSQTVIVDAINRRGKPFRCQVVCSPLNGADSESRGVIMVMEETAAETRS